MLHFFCGICGLFLDFVWNPVAGLVAIKSLEASSVETRSYLGRFFF